jgi:hypothetical protein
LTGPIEAGRIDSVRKAHGGQRQRLDRAARHPRRRRTAGAGFGAARDDLFQEGQERQVQRVIAPAHQFILAVGGEEELLQVIAADRDEIGQLEEGLRRIGQRLGVSSIAPISSRSGTGWPSDFSRCNSRRVWARAAGIR